MGTLAYMSPEQAEGLRRRPGGRRLLARPDPVRVLERGKPAPARQRGRHRARDRRAAPDRCAASVPTCRATSARRSTPASIPARPRRPWLEDLGAAIEDSLDELADHRALRPARIGDSARASPRCRGARRLARRSATGSPCRRIPAGFSAARGEIDPRPKGAFRSAVLRNLESRIEGLVEGVFSRAFSSEVQPVELARKLAKEMDAHKTASMQRVYVPNEYTVFLSKPDRSKLEGYERSLEQELSGYLLEHARRRSYDLLTRPAVVASRPTSGCG